MDYSRWRHRLTLLKEQVQTCSRTTSLATTMAAADATFNLLVRLLSVPLQWSMNPLIPAIVACLAVVSISAFFLRPKASDKIHDLGGIPILTAWDFFKKRFDFVQVHFEKSGGKMFRFRVLQASSQLTKSLCDC